jgi:hypothetical protein
MRVTRVAAKQDSVRYLDKHETRKLAIVAIDYDTVVLASLGRYFNLSGNLRKEISPPHSTHA